MGGGGVDLAAIGASGGGKPVLFHLRAAAVAVASGQHKPGAGRFLENARNGGQEL
jgi:hypothetical protein